MGVYLCIHMFHYKCVEVRGQPQVAVLTIRLISLWVLALQMCTATSDFTWVLEIRILILALGWQGLFLLGQLSALWDFLYATLTLCSELNREKKKKWQESIHQSMWATISPPRKGLPSTLAWASWQDQKLKNCKTKAVEHLASRARTYVQS